METLSYCQLMQRCGELEAQVKQLAAENAGMDSFVAAMLAIAWQGSSADGSDIQELALKCGLIRQEVYCADKHENMVDDPGNFEDGDALYFRVETPATDAIIASLRAEGVEMFVEHCKNSAIVKNYDFWMDASACAESFAAQLRSKSEVQHD